MRRTLLALAAVATTLTAAPLGAEPRVLKPYGPWNVDFGDDLCRLQRLFGSADDKQVLVFQQYWPSDRAGLTLAGSAFAKFRSLARTDVRFYEEQEPLRATPFTGTFGDIGEALIFPNIRLDQPEPLETREVISDKPFEQMDLELGKKARFVEVRQGGQKVRFETGALNAPFEVLNQCTLQLLRVIGLNADKHLTMQSEARWLNRDALVRRIVADYPNQAQANGEQGIMRMRVIINTDGGVENCRILKATITERLESPACKVMEHAQFAPALDAEGKPFRSLYATTITYKIGG